MDGMDLENGMAFLCRKGKHTKEGRNYDTIRYEGVGVGVGVARVNTINLTFPYLTLLFTHAFSTVCRRVTFRLLFATLHATYLLPPIVGAR